MRSLKTRTAVKTTTNRPPWSATGNTTLPGSPWAIASRIDVWPQTLKTPRPANQARDLLAQPELDTMEGKRDRAILAVLLGCALRRSELAALECGHIQQRDGRWVFVDLGGDVSTLVSRLPAKNRGTTGSEGCLTPESNALPHRSV